LVGELELDRLRSEAERRPIESDLGYEKRSLVEQHLNSRHRDTVEKIFSHPTNRNIEWRQVVALLEAIGTVTQEHNGKLKVELGPETEVLPAPHGKDVDVQMVVDLRRMLTQAGFAPDGSAAVPDERSRDHGDSQRGEPT
jgi:hypothetical protein